MGTTGENNCCRVITKLAAIDRNLAKSIHNVMLLSQILYRLLAHHYYGLSLEVHLCAIKSERETKRSLHKEDMNLNDVEM